MRTLLFSAVIALASIGCSKSDDKKDDKAEVEKLPEISIADVATGLEAKTLTLFDCNNDKTRKKHGVIPGAVLVEDEETFPESILPKDKSAKLVFYCGGPG